MASKSNRLPINVEGPWYVDDSCIDCGLCSELSPQVFQRDADGGTSYVYRQPQTDEDLARSEEARDSCPVEAIGNDG